MIQYAIQENQFVPYVSIWVNVSFDTASVSYEILRYKICYNTLTQN